jgi:hypothetical protein
MNRTYRLFKEALSSVAAMSADEFREWARSVGGATEEAMKLGVSLIGNARAIAALKNAQASAESEYRAALQAATSSKGDTVKAWNDVLSLAVKAQYFSEAISSAEGTGCALHHREVVAAHEAWREKAGAAQMGRSYAANPDLVTV